jgi:hypothetical protein
MAEQDPYRRERELLDRAAATITYPQVPALRARVIAAISAAPRDTRAGRRPNLRFAAAGAAIVAAVLGVALGVRDSRDAIAEFFGIEGSEITVLPTPAAGVSPTPLPEPEELERFATPVAFADAAGAAGFEPALPEGQVAPVASFIVEFDVDARAVVLQYVQFDLWESQFDAGVISKGVPPDVVIEEIFLRDGTPARRIEGGRHIVQFRNEAGTPVAGTLRTVDRNTLIWRTGTAFYRIETDLSLDDAVRIADSLP